jgi:urocanate hydratase
MKKAKFILPFFFFGLLVHSSGQTLSNRHKIIIEKQVDSIFHKMISAAQNLEFDILSQGVDDKQNAGFIAYGAYFAKYDSLINIVKKRSQGVLKQSIALQKEKITVLSDKIVLLVAYGDAIIDVSSGNSFTSKFYWSFVYEKINDLWKVIQSHQSSVR